MKNIQSILKGLVVIIFLLLVQHKLKAQNTPKQYVKVVVKGVNSPQSARLLNTYIETQAGVLTSRMDYRTNIYFGVFETSSGLNISDFKQWISDKGFEPKCGFVENLNQGKIKSLKISDCNTTHFNNEFEE